MYIVPTITDWAKPKSCLSHSVSLPTTVARFSSNQHKRVKTYSMVCDKCQKKLGKVITPDPWKAGARNTTEGGGRKVGENKALSSKTNRFNPYSKFDKCRICKTTVHQPGSHYCQGCAYKKGICAMCGKKVLETANYRQSST